MRNRLLWFDNIKILLVMLLLFLFTSCVTTKSGNFNTNIPRRSLEQLNQGLPYNISAQSALTVPRYRKVIQSKDTVYSPENAHIGQKFSEINIPLSKIKFSDGSSINTFTDLANFFGLFTWDFNWVLYYLFDIKTYQYEDNLPNFIKKISPKDIFNKALEYSKTLKNSITEWNKFSSRSASLRAVWVFYENGIWVNTDYKRYLLMIFSRTLQSWGINDFFELQPTEPEIFSINTFLLKETKTFNSLTLLTTQSRANYFGIPIGRQTQLEGIIRENILQISPYNFVKIIHNQAYEVYKKIYNFMLSSTIEAISTSYSIDPFYFLFTELSQIWGTDFLDEPDF